MVYPFYNPDQAGKRGNRLSVAVSFYPIYDIVKNIGGDRIYLKQIIPFGTEPHSFEPTPKDMMEIGNSQLFIYNGLIDPWAKSIADNFPREKSNLNLSTAVIIENGDPHYWLDFENYKKMINSVLEKMVSLDVQNEQFFRANADKLIKEVISLESEYDTNLNSCKNNNIIVNHNYFQYIAKKYGFETTPIMGLSPDEKPSAKQVAEIIDIVKEKNISTIFFEELVSSSIAESISRETGAKVSSLSPLGNVSPERVNDGFIELMRGNLRELKEALDCQ
jgi:zinc transport system substrate-binding protein